MMAAKSLDSPAEVASVFGKTERTVRRWFEAGCPRPPVTRAEVAAWRESRRARRTRPESRDVDAELASDRAGMVNGDTAEWTVKYRQAKALGAMLDLRERRGELIKKSEVAALFAERVSEVRSALGVLGQRVAARFSSAIRSALRAAIEEEVREICDRYARTAPLLEESKLARKDSRGGRR